MPFPNNANQGLHAALFPQSTNLDGLVNDFLDALIPSRGLAKGIRPVMPATTYLQLGSGGDEPSKPQPGDPGYDPDPGFSEPRMGIGGNPIPMPSTPEGDGNPYDYPRRRIRPNPGGTMEYAYHWGDDAHESGSNSPWVTAGQPAAITWNSEPFGLSRGHDASGSGGASDNPGIQPRHSGIQFNGADSSPPSGPAKASSFMDPRTGKLDYWSWLDAGAARIGQGGVVLEDDSPEFMTQNGIMNRPAAMIDAGAPHNAAPPRDSFVQVGPPGW